MPVNYCCFIIFHIPDYEEVQQCYRCTTWKGFRIFSLTFYQIRNKDQNNFLILLELHKTPRN